jgi:hypothetical protein
MNAEAQRAIELDGNQRELNKQLDAFAAKFGVWELTQFLLNQLAERQRKDGHVTKADYAGERYRITVKLLK